MGYGPAQGRIINPIALIEQPDPTAIADVGHTYTNDISGNTELMYLDSSGTEIQMTSGGSLSGGSVGGFTEGSIVFADPTGKLTEDNTKIFWDDTDDRLGINVAAPTVPLDVLGDGLLSGKLTVRGSEDFVICSTISNKVEIGINPASLENAIRFDSGTDAMSFYDGGGTKQLDITLTSVDVTPTLKPSSDIELQTDSDIVPLTDLTGEVGTDAKRFKRMRAEEVVTGDLRMKATDGSAEWVLEEKIDGIEARNIKTGKVYRLAMEEVN